MIGNLENEKGCEHSLASDNNDLTIIEADLYKIAKVTKELNIDNSTIIRDLSPVEKQKKTEQMGVKLIGEISNNLAKSALCIFCITRMIPFSITLSYVM